MLDGRTHRSRFSRRTFLEGLRYAPVLFLPAPLRGFKCSNTLAFGFPAEPPHADARITPRYPAVSPLDEMLRLVAPGRDWFVTEKYVREIEDLLRNCQNELTSSGDCVDAIRKLADSSLRASSLQSTSERVIRNRYGVNVTQRQFGADLKLDRDKFLDQLRAYFVALPTVRSAEFQITGVRELSTAPLHIATDIRCCFVGENRAGQQEQRIGFWRTEWLKQLDGQWRLVTFQLSNEAISAATSPLFLDISTHAFGNLPSYKEQLLRGADYWRTVLDGASGIDVYGNQGIAIGDFDGDGYDDIYICQPAGLPNRLYRNLHDGTFEDVSARAGVDVLDSTSCALFADFDNRGTQDLLVVTTAGPLLFVNEGKKFSVKPEAFKFANPPQGTFTHASAADYDRDGRLDIYFCVYNYYAGLDQYRYPSPYFDARNGPPNFLFHNNGNWNFEDRTAVTGLNVDNDRYSFACAWGDHNGNGWPDLYVANDFGRNNLYRNNGGGTFTSIASQAGVEEVGAGMSACWLDFDGDGKQDIYVANMWSAAGLRVSTQQVFHADDPEEVRALYRRHARGNSLYQNLGDGKFKNVAEETGTEFGRWAWSSDSFDFDQDGYPDLYLANGYVSGSDPTDLSSFFWRQVVGNSPRSFLPAAKYELAWNAINELIRSDRSWSGYERNVLYCNNHDGTFSDLSGVSGLDFPDDSRAFALADFDHDGRLEIFLKNRNAPQLQLLHNVIPDIGNSIAFRLHGTKSNRDAIGAAVTVEAEGHRQTKYLQAGSGFLSQHTKLLFFGIGNTKDFVRATIRWPNKSVQVLDRVPANCRIEVTEGSDDWQSESFSPSRQIPSRPPKTRVVEGLPESVETWLLEPLHAPGFNLNDTSGKSWDLHELTGNKLLTFWAGDSEVSRNQLRQLRKYRPGTSEIRILAMNVNDPPNEAALRAFVEQEKVPFPVLLTTKDIVGVYNIVYRYLFERHRDMSLPTSFLVDGNGMIVKIYQGEATTERIAADLGSMPLNSTDRIKKALPFPGTLHLGAFQRNDFTYGVAFFQRGYLEAATEAFSQVIDARPDDSEAHYNLGTLCLRRKDFAAARTHLEKALQLKPNHAEAWNNLGMLAAEQGNSDEAVKDFKQSLSLQPHYAVALLNLGNVYRRQRQFTEAEQLLTQALEVDPDNPEASYSLAMLYAQQDQSDRAKRNFERALALRPGYSDALNNFAILLIREQNYSEAEEKFETCIQSNPDFDQPYLNLARLYILLNDKTKARDTLQALLRRQPTNEAARQTLKVLE